MTASHRLLTLSLAALALAGCRAPLADTALGPAAEAEAAGGLRPAGREATLQVGGLITDALRHPAIARNSGDDEYLGVWAEKRDGQFHVYARRLDGQLRQLSVGKSAAPLVCLSGLEGEQTAPSVAFDGQGYVAVWQDTRPDAPGVYARRLNRDGEPVGEAYRLGAAGAVQPAIADAPTGGALLTAWNEEGRVKASFVSASGPSAVVTLADRADGFLGLGAGVRQAEPLVAAAPGQARALVVWRDGSTLKARTLETSGTAGDTLALGDGEEAAIAYGAADQRFMVAFRQGGRVQARTVALGGAIGPTVDLGSGMSPTVSWHPQAGAFQALWTDGGYLVSQRLSPTLAPLGAAALLPSAGAKHPVLAYDDKRQGHVFVAEERAYSFDRLSALKLF